MGSHGQIQTEDNKLPLKLQIAGLVVAIIGVVITIAKAASDEPSVMGMAISFLTGVLGASIVVFMSLVVRYLSWRANLNEHWPLAGSLAFQTSATTGDNLYATIIVNAVNLSPAPITIEELSSPRVFVGGKLIEPEYLRFEGAERRIEKIGTAVETFRVRVPIAYNTFPVTGRIRVDAQLSRPFSTTTSVPHHDIAFSVMAAMPGPRTK